MTTLPHSPVLQSGDLLSTHAGLASSVRRTPLVPVVFPDEGRGERPVLVKAELLQVGGSFKVRGALNALRGLPAQALRQGVVSMSAGNHAIAVAWAARQVGTSATLVMPEQASRSKIAQTQSYGAEVVLTSDSLVETLHRIQAERGLTLIHPFDDPLVVQGAAGVGIELIQDAPEPLEAVYVPVGGGGLISGIAIAMQNFSPSTRVIGVEPEGADAMTRALNGDEPPKQQVSVADGLKAPYAGTLNTMIVRDLVDEVVTVTETELRHAFGLMYQHAKLAIEPSAAAGLAGLLAQGRPDGPVAIIASGGNVDLTTTASLLHDAY